MKLVINGEEKHIDKQVTITKLLEIQNVKMPEMVSVELNGEILDRQDFDRIMVKENDEIEFLYFMGGGAFGV